jgi:hypothetical protein
MSMKFGKNDEISGEYGTREKDNKYIQNIAGNLKERSHL